MAGKDYRDLVVWQKAMDLVDLVYSVTRRFPIDERFGLVAQMRRAAVSIPSNIAEGQGRGGKKEFCRFLHISHGSIRELETQIMISQRQAMADEEAINRLLSMAAEVGRMVQGLIRSLGEP